VSDVQLILGDCLEEMKQFADGQFDAVIADIPYNEVSRPSGGLRNLDKGLADVATFQLDAFLKATDKVCGGSFYVFCGAEQLSEIRIYFNEHGISGRTLIWEKTNPSPMNGKSIWLSGNELCAYGKKGGAT